MPAVRFFLVLKRLVRAHRALPAHSSRRFLQPSIATCGSTQFLSVIAFRPCMRTKFLFANLAINGFLFIASCAACELLFYWSPPAHFATDGLIRRRPNGLRVSRARFFCRCRFSPFAGMALFAAFRLPSGNTRKPILSPFVFVRYRYRAVSRNFSVQRKTGSDGTCLSRKATPCALPRLRFLCPNIKTVKFAPDSYTSRIKQIKS